MIHHISLNTVLEWDEDNRCVIFTRRGYNEGESFRSEHLRMIELLEQTGCGKLISDLRNMRVVSREDQQWMLEYLSPRAVAAGLKYEATILPQSMLAQVTISNLRNSFDSSWEMVNFATREEALAWLKSK